MIEFPPSTGCPINMETRSTLIFSFCIRATAKVKPVLKNSDPNLQGVPGYMNPRKQNLWKFWKRGVAWRQKKFQFLFRFLSTLKINLIFWKNIKIKVAPWRFGSKFFKTGCTFAVALIQNEKIKVERVSILMWHPVHSRSFKF